MTPILLENGNDSGNGVVPLKAIQQAVILARCLLIEMSTRQDELQSKLFEYASEL